MKLNAFGVVAGVFCMAAGALNVVVTSLRARGHEIFEARQLSRRELTGQLLLGVGIVLVGVMSVLGHGPVGLVLRPVLDPTVMVLMVVALTMVTSRRTLRSEQASTDTVPKRGG